MAMTAGERGLEWILEKRLDVHARWFAWRVGAHDRLLVEQLVMTGARA